MSKTQLPQAAKQFQEVMKKRSLQYEQIAEKTIYVDMPQVAMEFDQLLKTHPFLQPQFTEEVQSYYRKLLHFDAQNLPDIDKILEQLQIPPTQFINVEDFLRERISPILELTERIMKWIYSLITNKAEQDDGSDKMQEALVQVEENCNQVIDSLLQYHQTRGKLLGKLQKRKLFDVAKTLAQYDIAHAQDIKNGFVDLYNTIIGAYDSCIKNFENVKNSKPQVQFQNMF